MYEARFKKYQIFVLLNYAMMFIDTLPKCEGAMIDLGILSYVSQLQYSEGMDKELDPKMT